MSVEKIIIGYAISDDPIKSTLFDFGIQDSWFSDYNAQTSWKAIRTLLNGTSEINLVTVGAVIPQQAVFLIECLEIKPMGQDILYYLKEIQSLHWARKSREEINEVLKKLSAVKNGLDVEECHAMLDSVSRQAVLDFNGSSKTSIKIPRVLDICVDEFEKRVIDKQMGNSRGLSTGIKNLDASIHGWMPGTLNILAARTSLGKTTLAINFSNTAIDSGKKVLFFTNEMPAQQIAEKQLSLRTGIFNHKLFSGSLDEKDLDKLHQGISGFYNKSLSINDRSGRRLSKFLSEVKRLHREDGLDMVILDYIQQMSADDGNKYPSRVLELGVIANAIKELALDLKIPIICLAQCNRQAENSDDPPNLSHIRDSGAIEQDADTVIFIHRDRTVAEGKCILAVAKNRFGPTGDIEINVDLRVNRFY